MPVISLVDRSRGTCNSDGGHPGHERKLHGAYRGQTRWLKDNRDEVATFLGVKPPEVAATTQRLQMDVAVADLKIVSADSGALAALKRLLSARR